MTLEQQNALTSEPAENECSGSTSGSPSCSTSLFDVATLDDVRQVRAESAGEAVLKFFSDLCEVQAAVGTFYRVRQRSCACGSDSVEQTKQTCWFRCKACRAKWRSPWKFGLSEEMIET